MIRFFKRRRPKHLADTRPSDLQAEAAQALAETARFEALTNQAETSGAVFDYSQPLPPMPHYRPREWETALKAAA